MCVGLMKDAGNASIKLMVINVCLCLDVVFISAGVDAIHPIIKDIENVRIAKWISILFVHQLPNIYGIPKSYHEMFMKLLRQPT